MSKKKKNIMRAFKIKEISAVDTPAQSGARMVIMKRKEPDIFKGIKLTTSVNGHSHLIQSDSIEGGETSWNKSEGEEYGHTHPWVRNEDGSITIGETDGHTHDIVEVSQDSKKIQSNQTGKLDGNGAVKDETTELIGKTKESRMSGKNENDPDLSVELAKAKEELAIAKAYGQLTDVEKSYYNGLTDEDKVIFIQKTSDQRKSEIESKKANDPVVYKALNGDEFRQSDDPRIINQAKRADENQKALELAKANQEEAEFTKSATSDLSHLTGTIEAKVSLLRAVSKIADVKVKEEVTAILKAHNESMSQAFKTYGTTGSSAVGASSSDQLDSLAKKYAEDHKVSYAKAYQEVLNTEQGRKLYGQTAN